MNSGRFHMKPNGFHMKSPYKPYKSNNSRKTLQLYGVQWEGYVMISHEIRWISCEIRRISKDQLPGMVRLMFSEVVQTMSALLKLLSSTTLAAKLKFKTKKAN